MNACCVVAKNRKASRRVRTAREVLSWALPSAILVSVPKCPACLAAYVALWTGLGLSFSAAANLRWLLMFFCVAALLCLVVERLSRIRATLTHHKETVPCNTR
jgi:hypothetical protein